MSKQPRKRRRIDSKEEMKSMMKELAGQMVPVIVDLITYTTPTHVDETPDLHNFSEQEIQEFLQPMN